MLRPLFVQPSVLALFDKYKDSKGKQAKLKSPNQLQVGVQKLCVGAGGSMRMGVGGCSCAAFMCLFVY